MGEMETRFHKCSAAYVLGLKCRNASSRNEEHLKRAMFSQVPIHVIQIIFYNVS